MPLAKVLIREHPELNSIIPSIETQLVLVKINKCVNVTRFQTVSEWISG
jgi:hypothetical protein